MFIYAMFVLVKWGLKMSKRVNKKWWDSHIIVFGMESEEKNQEMKNTLEDEFNKKLEEEEDGN
jgi:hypothetical protein